MLNAWKSQSMSIKEKYKVISILFLSQLLTIAVLIFFMIEESEDLLQAELQQAKSTRLADRLRQSSDDLTRMARSYVITGEPRFKQYFEDILGIRDGSLPRPPGYNDIYWDYVVASPEGPPENIGKPASLFSLFEELDATPEELNLLRQALDRSNQLAIIEIEALAAMNERLKHHETTHDSETLPYQEYAVGLLFSDEYHQAKAKIMHFIDQFSQQITVRSAAIVAKHRGHQRTLLLATLLIILFSAAIFIYIILNTRAKLIQPILELSHISNRIKEGHITERAKTESDDEVGVLINSFNGMNDSLNQIISELENLSHVDPLTQLSNRRLFDQTLNNELKRHVREQAPLALMIIDFDHFKHLNDEEGHQAGDMHLKRLGNILSSCFKRAGDLIARYGGDEFIVLMPNTDLDSNAGFVSEVCNQVENARIPHPASKVSQYITVSIGAVSLVPNRKTSTDEILKLADEALYKAKEAGRNCGILSST